VIVYRAPLDVPGTWRSSPALAALGRGRVFATCRASLTMGHHAAARLLLQVRARVLSEQLVGDFHRWHPGFYQARVPVALAA
jgi:hypothetical protein